MLEQDLCPDEPEPHPVVRRRRCRADRCLNLPLTAIHRAGLIRTGEVRSGYLEWRYDDGTAPHGRVALIVDLRSETTPGIRPSYRVTAGSKVGDVVQTIGPTIGTIFLLKARWWFACPGCARRTQVLYLPPSASRFLCRICHDMWLRCGRER
jgi:hypothetical protein